MKMVRKKEEQRTELRENVCGGKGLAQVRNLFEAQEMQDVRLLNHITLDPGAEFGVHTHHNEAEIYYILSGELVTEDESGQHCLSSGDASYTGDGSFHSLKNTGDSPAELLAVIVGNGSVSMGKTKES